MGISTIKGFMRGCNVMRNKQVGLLMVLLVILAMGSILLTACARPGTPSASASKGNNSGGGGGNNGHIGKKKFLVGTVNIWKGSKNNMVDDVAGINNIKKRERECGREKKNE